jgi:A/G-specific adenine glycosylase
MIVPVRRAGPKQQWRAPARAAAFRRRLLGWYTRHRRDLPWRGVRNPYAVLVSEIMLQQTQVARVIDYYPRFLARYPSCEALAAASPDAVRESWDGLGYYARARNLHRAAQQIVAECDGQVPSRPEDLRRLPGIGRYTAGAVASLAYGAPVAAVDTNAARVLARVFRIRGRAAARTRRIWARAESLVPRRRSADWNQALMDLGALYCTARAPRCPTCPVRRVCASA